MNPVLTKLIIIHFSSKRVLKVTLKLKNIYEVNLMAEREVILCALETNTTKPLLKVEYYQFCADKKFLKFLFESNYVDQKHFLIL